MGKAVQIVSIGRDHTVQLNKDELERILSAPNVKDKPVAVVSIMGAFRQGKSFLMNLLLRYLNSHDKSNWIVGDTPFGGFPWSSKSTRETEGINVWDEVLLVPTPEDGELAVLLMDTQGAFDNESSADETANIFALSILASSLQIYNIFRQLQMDQLNHLQLVAEYGKLAQKATGTSQFQKLVLLIRDWQFSDLPHGVEGGRGHLDQFMKKSTKQCPENKELLQSVFSCFSSTDCFLMPALGPLTEGSDDILSKLNNEFKQKLEVLVPWILAPKHLQAKTIAGSKITCEQLFYYFRAYVSVFKDGKRPPVETLMHATAKEMNRIAKEEAKAFYEKEMCKVTYQSVQELERAHRTLIKKVTEKFLAAQKIGGDKITRRYQDTLEKEITQIFDGLCFKQKLKDMEKMQKQMEEELLRGLNYLQEMQKVLEQTTDKLERTTTYLQMKDQMDGTFQTINTILAPFTVLATCISPPMGAFIGATTNLTMDTMKAELNSAMRRASENEYRASYHQARLTAGEPLTDLARSVSASAANRRRICGEDDFREPAAHGPPEPMELLSQLLKTLATPLNAVQLAAENRGLLEGDHTTNDNTPPHHDSRKNL